ncbi:MAG: helix-turn-helix domain-containing protein, partial [Hungatella sp.]|nr:helix-turn-helix domain-containing protein [Hungatella sp.]
KSVNSSNISSIGYEGSTLHIRFNSGGLYAYFNVPFVIYNILERIAGKISKPDLELPDNSYSKETTHDILKIKNYIDNHFSKSIIVSDMAQKANLSYGYFSHSFRDIVGVSFSDYLINIRIEKAKEYLITTHQSISQISNDVGYTDEKYFSRVLKKMTGYTPSGYRNKCF